MLMGHLLRVGSLYMVQYCPPYVHVGLGGTQNIYMSDTSGISLLSKLEWF